MSVVGGQAGAIGATTDGKQFLSTFPVFEVSERPRDVLMIAACRDKLHLVVNLSNVSSITATTDPSVYKLKVVVTNAFGSSASQVVEFTKESQATKPAVMLDPPPAQFSPR